MASSKDVFEPKTFAANIFASGVFRGIGVTATVARQALGKLFIQPRAVATLSTRPRASGKLV